MEIEFTTKLWEWQGQGAWCFVSLPKKFYQEIRTLSSSSKRGFGSVRVEAIIGKTTWKTSIFPDKKLATYLLPAKKAVRENEKIEIGDTIYVKLKLIDI